MLHTIDFDPAPMLTALPESRLETPAQAYEYLGYMHEVAQADGSDFAYLAPFLHIYHHLTGIVLRDLELGRYDDPASLEMAVPDFAQRCVDPVNDFFNRRFDKVPAQWRLTLDPELMRRARKIIQFTGGMLAHIDRDLPFTVAHVGAPRSYRPDYFERVGHNIGEAAEDLAAEYLPVSSRLRRRIVTASVGGIATRRKVAWFNGEDLLRADGDPDEIARIERYLDRMSYRHGLLARYVGNPVLGLAEIFAPADSDDESEQELRPVA